MFRCTNKDNFRGIVPLKKVKRISKNPVKKFKCQVYKACQILLNLFKSWTCCTPAAILTQIYTLSINWIYMLIILYYNCIVFARKNCYYKWIISIVRIKLNVLGIFYTLLLMFFWIIEVEFARWINFLYYNFNFYFHCSFILYNVHDIILLFILNQFINIILK